MPRSVKEVEVLLLKLEHCLKKVELWSDTIPSSEALASQVPFAYDKMPLEHWLQFIFIPKMYTLLDSELPLPNNMNLLPLSQMCFVDVVKYKTLLTTIENIDELFSE